MLEVHLEIAAFVWNRVLRVLSEWQTRVSRKVNSCFMKRQRKEMTLRNMTLRVYRLQTLAWQIKWFDIFLIAMEMAINNSFKWFILVQNKVKTNLAIICAYVYKGEQDFQKTINRCYNKWNLWIKCMKCRWILTIVVQKKSEVEKLSQMKC